MSQHIDPPEPRSEVLGQTLRQLLGRLKRGENYGTLIVPASPEFSQPMLVATARGEVATVLLAYLLNLELKDPEAARAHAELFLLGSPFPDLPGGTGPEQS